MRLLTLVSAVMGPTCVALGQKSPPDEDPRLDATDCQIRCPQSSNSQKIVLPALSQKVDASGLAENTLECWQIDSLSTSIPGIDNAFRLDWEDGFDAAYQYIFTGPSFMPSHPAPEPSLIVMSSGIGDLRVPSGKCLRVGAGDIFFSVGTDGRQTAWWSEGTVVSDFYFKGGKIPEHDVLPELAMGVEQSLFQQSTLEM